MLKRALADSLSCHLRYIIFLLAVAFAGFPMLLLPLKAEATSFGTASVSELVDLSMDDLMQVEVFSVSKQPETVFSAASAVYVITSDDIRKSGAISLPEVLRLAPGVQVAKIDGNKWAISIRGFAGRFTNKLLVLQDGRTLYDPLFSGVYWNVQEVMLEDIEQIEIVRGPAATLWGVNAVNGVINITTKHAKETQGGLITAVGGTLEQGSTGVRYGTKIGNGYLRAYGKYFNREVRMPTDSSPASDGRWVDWRGGFRGDWDTAADGSLTLQGDAYQNADAVARYLGDNLLGRWKTVISETSTLSLQLYYDRNSVKRRSQSDNDESHDTGDIELQQTFAVGERQHLVWGAGFRVLSDRMSPDPAADPTYLPLNRTDHLFTAFLQDKITLLSDKIYLILGSRLERNDITHWELQPTARLLVTPDDRHTFWSAVSRAVRTPSRAETSISATVDFIPPSTVVRLQGNPDLKSETMIAYEAGYRYQPQENLSFDLALYYNDYRSLVGVVQGAPVGGTADTPPALIPINVQPTATAVGKGGELLVNWRPLTWVDLALAYSYLDLSVTSQSSLPFDRMVMNADTSPRHLLSVISKLDLPRNVKCSLWLRYADSLPGAGIADYVTADARVAWKPLADLELSLVGQNLLQSKHREFGPDLFGNPSVDVGRSMYGKIVWTF